MNLTEIFIIIIAHWIADFVLQTHYQATNKSKSWNALLAHTLTYSAFLWIVMIIMLVDVYIPLYFGAITLVLHTITDYFTSRLNSKLWAKGDVHNFFVSIGFDQVLHYVQLFLTYVLLK